MSQASLVEGIRSKFERLGPLMNERLRRQWAACETLTLPRGGVTLVAQATGLSRTTIWAGRKELRQQEQRAVEDLQPERVRATGGGAAVGGKAHPTNRADTRVPLLAAD